MMKRRVWLVFELLRVVARPGWGILVLLQLKGTAVSRVSNYYVDLHTGKRE